MVATILGLKKATRPIGMAHTWTIAMMTVRTTMRTIISRMDKIQMTPIKAIATIIIRATTTMVIELQMIGIRNTTKTITKTIKRMTSTRIWIILNATSKTLNRTGRTGRMMGQTRKNPTIMTATKMVT